MKTILCYGDSNTHGAGTDGIRDHRYGPRERYTGVLRAELGEDWQVIEEGLGGRTTVSDDPVEGADRNGRTYLKPCIESHWPLDMITIMLGTNDLKRRFNKDAPEIARGVEALVKDIKAMKPGRGETTPEILIICPPVILPEPPGFHHMFDGGHETSKNLPAEYRRIADLQEVHFLDANDHITSSPKDGIHFEVEEHTKLGKAIAQMVQKIF